MDTVNPMSGGTAESVRAALRLRWPDEQYLTVVEAPQDATRTGGKVDVLVVSLWASRGYELDAVEIKVSASDWKRELDNAPKADFWWRHSHRFWLATTVPLAAKVRDDLPAGWGLLACADGSKPHVVVKPERRTPEPLAWPTTVGLLRAAADAGVQALWRAEERGRERGYKEGQKHGPDRQADQLREQFADVQRRVSQFEAASGVTLGEYWNNHAADAGKAVALVLQQLRTGQSLAPYANRLATDAAALQRLTAEIDEALGVKP